MLRFAVRGKRGVAAAAGLATRASIAADTTAGRWDEFLGTGSRPAVETTTIACVALSGMPYPQYAESRVLTPDPESCTSQTHRWVEFFFFCFVFFLDEYVFLLSSPSATNRTLEALDAILKPHANCRIARLSNFERWIRAHPSFSGAAAEAAVAAAVADRGARCSESSPFPPVNIDGCCGVCSHL
jgi:hypothetical protein